jgi:hypothetical protein
LNAGSAKRRVKYTTPVATMSSGYDSAACAAIAKDHGCEEAVTYRLSPEDQLLFVGGNDDCGTAIAEKLGLRIRERDPKGYLKYDNLPEAEFVATGYGDEALSMSVFEADFSQRLVITGVHGGTVWSRIPRTKLVNDICQPDGCGCSLAEFRYRVGFIHVPLPFIGSFNNPSIFRITLSEEMKSYSIGGNYDRPIPRRILEEKGVDRGLFGQKKAGLLPGLLGSNKTELQRRMTKKSFMSFEKYYQQNRSKRCFLSTVVHMGLFAFYKYYSRLLFRVSRRKDMITILGCPIPGKFRNSPLRKNFLFNW